MLKRFVIVGTQRTGSSAFAESLNMHPEIACGWEWGQRGYFVNKVRVAEAAFSGDFSRLRTFEREHIESLLKKNPRWIGYRRLFRSSNKWILSPRLSPAILVDQMPKYLDWLKKNKEIHVIHIVRSDNIAWLRSKYIANYTKSYVGKPYPKDISIVIPTGQALKRVQSKEWVDGQLAELSATNPYRRVYYEDYTHDQRSLMASCFSFLECDSHGIVESGHRIKRQSLKAPDDQIANFDALKEVLIRHGLLYSAFDQDAITRSNALKCSRD